jgi:hypothetical protein
MADLAGDDLGGFAPPPFDASQALQQLQRALRDLRLAERGYGFELRGRRVAELLIDSGVLHARLARRPALTPEWERTQLKSATEQRKWLGEVKKRLAKWEADE